VATPSVQFPRPLWAGGRGRGLRAAARQESSATAAWDPAAAACLPSRRPHAAHGTLTTERSSKGSGEKRRARPRARPRDPEPTAP